MGRLTPTVVAVFACAVIGPASLLAQDATPAAGVGEAVERVSWE